MHFLFDFDGTLALSLNLILQAYHELAPKYHLKVIDATMTEALRTKGAKELFKISGLSLFQLPAFSRDFKAFAGKHITTVPVVPDLPAVLGQLTQANHHLGVVSSNSAENIQAFLDHHQLTACFDFIRSEDNFWGKGAALKKVLKQYQLHPSETLYVGDESRDIEAARQAGIKIAAVTWGFNTKEMLQAAGADFILDQPTDLLKINLTR